MRFALWMAAVLTAGSAHAARPCARLDEPCVAPQSQAMEALRREAAGGDISHLLVARETLRIAGETEAVRALDRELAREALARLGSGGASRPATVGELIASPPAAPDADEMRRAMESLVRPRLAPIDDASGRLAQGGNAENRPLAPALWGTYRKGRLDLLTLFVAIEALRDGVTQLDAFLRVDLASGKPVHLQCKPSPWNEQSLAAGEARLYECFAHAGRIEVPLLAEAVRAVADDPARWRLEPSRVELLQPRVSLSTRGVYWLDAGAAHRQAVANLAAMDCGVRGACLEEAKRFLVQRRPDLGLALAGGIAGLVAGIAIVAFTRRRLRWAAFALLAAAVLALAIIGYAVAQSRGDNAFLLALMLGLFGGIALAGFVAGLALPLITALVMGRAAS